MNEVRIASIANRIAKFPPKAMNLNKLDDAEGFWNMSVFDAQRNNGITLRPKDMGDIIFFLNMVAGGWESGRRG